MSVALKNNRNLELVGFALIAVVISRGIAAAA
jgi:hypothetical protein